MTSRTVFELLEHAQLKPEVFSVYSAADLWTDEHTSEQMLAYHLNSEIDVSSRRAGFIDESVRWMTEHFQLNKTSRIADFGCGPGLYTSRLAALDVDVTGIDFSSRSIAYARGFAQTNGLDVNYVEANYLEHALEGQFDLIMMIMCDYCALSPQQRAELLSKFKRLLADGGSILLDVYSMQAFANKQETFYCEKNQLDGFWSAEPYYAFVSSFKYDEEAVSLDKYTIIEEASFREVYNWLQHFSPQTLEAEIRAAGLEIQGIYADVAGRPFDEASEEFAIELRRQQ